MEKFTAPFFEARLYIGSNTHYNGAPFSELDLMRAIGVFQKENRVDDKPIPVRITSTRYVCEDYTEIGWEVGIINYPRAPRSDDDLRVFILDLAKHLLEKFQQNRISVILPQGCDIVMYQADDAEESDNPQKVHKVN